MDRWMLKGRVSGNTDTRGYETAARAIVIMKKRVVKCKGTLDWKQHKKDGDDGRTRGEDGDEDTQST